MYYVLICEDTLEGILTAIYKAYEWKFVPADTKIVTSQVEQPDFLTTYHEVRTERDLARKVIRTILKRFGDAFYYDVALALSSYEEEKATAVYHVIAKGLKLSNPVSIMQQLADEDVHRMFAFRRNAYREYDHLRGFLRFEELPSGVLCSKIGPKNHLVSFLADHFADRLPSEAFVIYDENRKVAAVHEPQKKWYIVSDMSQITAWEESENLYPALFKLFCNHIAIKERENRDLQQQMLPQRFRQYMTEMR